MKQLGTSSPQDVYYYKPLHKVAKILGLLPLFDINDLSHHQPRIWNGFVVIACLIVWFSYATHGKAKNAWQYFPPSMVVTDFGGDSCIFLTNLASTWWLCIVKGRRQFSVLLQMLKHIDTELRTIQSGIEYPRRAFNTEFVLVNVFFAIYYVYDLVNWNRTVKWAMQRWYFLRGNQLYHVLVVSLLMRNYALAIRNRIRILNGLLEDTRPSQELLFSAPNSNIKTHTNYVNILRMRKIFASICRSIEMFNDIFGLMYLVLYVCIVVYIMTAANIGLLYGVGDYKIGTAEFGVTLVILCLLWILIPLTIGFLIFSSADDCYFEFKRTPWICYSIIDELTSINQKNILIPELEKFARQVNNSHAEITAAGWFTVNYAIFFALIGSLSSYIIVLIQFM